MTNHKQSLDQTISIDDKIHFKYHVDVLRLFGKDLKAHMKASYRFEDDWVVWFPKLYKNRDFINEITDDGKTITMRQLPTSIVRGDYVFPENEPGANIVFAHVADPGTKDKYYKFVGVFTRLEGNVKFASCHRLSSKLYFNDKGLFSI